jgi:hypothetical protein
VTLLRATAVLGAGPVASGMTRSATPAVAASRREKNDGHDGGALRVLQPGEGPGRVGTYIPSTLETIQWGRLPNADTKPVASVRSGAVVTFDTVSHEGILEDQGRDPVAFFGSFGVPRRDVLRDAIAIAGSDIQHDFANDGPNIVTGPVAIAGAEPGDVLEVDVLALRPRVPYGVVSNRHGKGALPEIFPETPPPEPGADAEHPERFHSVFVFVPVSTVRGDLRGLIPAGPHHQAQVPIEPFLGNDGASRSTRRTLSTRCRRTPPAGISSSTSLSAHTCGSP